MLLHHTCTVQNDMAINNPISGKATFRKINKGTWTQTFVTTSSECDGSSNCGMVYGPGIQGQAVKIKEMEVMEGGSTHMPNQKICVFTGGF